MPLPANIKDISADVLPAEVFLYPVCTTREGFASMLEAMDNYYLKQHERVEVIKDFLNAQEFVGNPMDQPCLKELVDELIASLPPAPEVIKYIVQECEFTEDEECDDMACQKCIEGSVIYCDGKLQYRQADGTYADVPSAAIPSGAIPPVDPENPVPAVGANACYKASGIWEYILRAGDHLIQTANDSGGFMDNYFAAQNSAYDYNNARLLTFMMNWTDTAATDGIHPDTTAYWNANQEIIANDFVCALQDILGKEDRLSTAEYDALIHLADIFDTGNNELNDLLFDAIKVIEKKAYEIEAYNAVVAQVGVCNCTQSGTPVPPLDDSDWIQLFDFEASGTLLGWVAYTPAGGDPVTAPTPGSDGLTGNVTTVGGVRRRSVNVTHDLPLADATTVIKQISAIWSVVESTNSNAEPAHLLRLRAHAEPGAQGSILGSIANDTLEFGTKVFTWSDLNWIGLDDQSSLLLNFQAGFRSPDDDIDPNGSIKVRRYELRGEGTNPFV